MPQITHCYIKITHLHNSIHHHASSKTARPITILSKTSTILRSFHTTPQAHQHSQAIPNPPYTQTNILSPNPLFPPTPPNPTAPPLQPPAFPATLDHPPRLATVSVLCTKEPRTRARAPIQQHAGCMRGAAINGRQRYVGIGRRECGCPGQGRGEVVSRCDGEEGDLGGGADRVCEDPDRGAGAGWLESWVDAVGGGWLYREEE